MEEPPIAKAAEVPDWVRYPDEDWETISPAEAGLDEQNRAEYVKHHPLEPRAWEAESHGDDEWGCTLARFGRYPLEADDVA